MQPRLTRRRLLGVAAALPLALPALAQQTVWPSRAIRLVVPWPPGGPIDLAARPIAARMSELLGQPMVIENRAGANGTIGAAHVAQSTPDGHTLLLASPGPVTIYPLSRNSADPDPLRPFAPITQLVSSPSVLVVRRDLRATNLAELVALARERADQISYGSAGVGSINHLSGASLAARAGVSLLHVPYQGATPLLNDLMAGRIDMAFLGIGVALPLVQQGNARGIAVGNARRATALPDLPTIAETYPGFQADNWYALFAPAGTPAPIIAHLHRTAGEAVRTPQVTRVLVEGGTEPAPSESPSAFLSMLQEDTERWRQSVRSAALRAE